MQKHTCVGGRAGPDDGRRGRDAGPPLSGKKLWEFDTNPKDSVWPQTRNEVIVTPVINNNRNQIFSFAVGAGAK